MKIAVAVYIISTMWEACCFSSFIGMLKLVSCSTTGHPYDVTILCRHTKSWHQLLSNSFSNFPVYQFTYGRCFVEHMGVRFVLLLILTRDDGTKMVPCTFFPFSMCLSFITINHLPVRVYCTLIPSVSCHCSQFLCFLPFPVCTFFILSFRDWCQLTLSIYFLMQQAQSLHHSNFLSKRYADMSDAVARDDIKWCCRSCGGWILHKFACHHKPVVGCSLPCMYLTSAKVISFQTFIAQSIF
jgi:hypothetical protein